MAGEGVLYLPVLYVVLFLCFLLYVVGFWALLSAREKRGRRNAEPREGVRRREKSESDEDTKKLAT